MTMFLTIFLTGVGLAMDAFAVSICKGLTMKKVTVKNAVIIAAFFGIFQALMPFLGWLLGSQFEQYIRNIDHWIAFALLAFIGGKMIFECLTEKEEDNENTPFQLNIKELFVLAIATSIDALAVGITFAFLGSEISIYESIAIIGITTFVISFAGVYIGKLFGGGLKKKAEIAGGIILILIGVKILLEHLGVIGF